MVDQIGNHNETDRNHNERDRRHPWWNLCLAVCRMWPFRKRVAPPPPPPPPAALQRAAAWLAVPAATCAAYPLSLCLLALLTFIAFKQAKRTRTRLRMGGKLVPGPPAIPVLGHYHEISGWFPTMHDYFTKFAGEYGATFLVRLPLSEIAMGARIYHTSEPKNVEHILKTNFDNYPKGDAPRERRSCNSNGSSQSVATLLTLRPPASSARTGGRPHVGGVARSAWRRHFPRGRPLLVRAAQDGLL